MTTPHRPAPATPRPLRRDAAQNREKLLRAAWEVFAELGPDAGVEEIAARAGVGMGTLYRRFPTKESLLAALSDEILDSILACFRHAAEQQPDELALEQALWDTGAVLAVRHGWLTRLWAAIPPEADERRAELLTLVGDLLARARHAGRIREDITLTDVYACLLALRVLIDDTEGQVPGVWRRHLAIVLAGFRPAAEPLACPPIDDALLRANTPEPHAQ
ncbi:helix-turn-helix domain-containing protein [Kitasatospora sp. NPDC097691]|uniref:TetR/AcrR family transcriptional regulator n=1 Tax=Kitasatospora sp. NPDC097691 TaxID=3157231 RepID=UPI00332E266C